jgi:glutamate 5-kinase
MYDRIVVKLGTSVLTGGTRRLDRANMVEIVRQCADLYRRGTDIIICTSGAIAVGQECLDIADTPETITEKQMLAAVGQSRLMLVWERLFDIYDIQVGQMLLTGADLKDRQRFLNARDAMETLLQHGIVPVINENDAVATEEIKVGDNDNLSAFVVLLAEADALILLTDQPGLFTDDPRANPDAELISEVRTIDETVHEVAGGSTSGLGIGGMTTKLQAADVARRAGADVMIASGHASEVIQRIFAGEQVGTRFPAVDTPLESRKRWIFAGSSSNTRITVDAGAARALRRDGSSLLPVGIVEVTGEFERGDTVFIEGPEGEEIARGITRYGSEDLAQIQGCQSTEIREQLGYDYGAVAVHRDDMILV